MAELLIKATDATHPDPQTDRSGCYKRGDVVAVMPDGHSWGPEELNREKFYLIRLPGVSPEALEKYLEPERDPVLREEVLTRRRWHGQKLPSSLKQALGSGPVDLTWKILREYIRDKATGLTEAGKEL